MFKTVKSNFTKSGTLKPKQTIHGAVSTMARIKNDAMKMEKKEINAFKQAHNLNDATKLKNKIYTTVTDQKEKDIQAGVAKDITAYTASSIDARLFSPTKTNETLFGINTSEDEKQAIESSQKDVKQLTGSSKTNFGNIYQEKNDFKKKIDITKDFKKN
ncbi:MAG: hypothetical protein LBQ45_01395 [Mycoplasmataceae bacterium]|jgi:hypothetical protein|nr:hypothetical protein [Mycoplasmataceae bacterium]